ncbi:hypothetical protein PG996_008041 [Apiospora saccharicola]|uniref:Uncharacterized protein n=1 Tax=Apiospora saccharicola TaxID=335842 RepID=A0ABR1UWT1_9PEZI
MSRLRRPASQAKATRTHPGGVLCPTSDEGEDSESLTGPQANNRSPCRHSGLTIDEWTFPLNLTTLLALIATVFRSATLHLLSSFERIDNRFHAFAAAVSARYRMSFGAQTYALGEDHKAAAGLAPGKAEGHATRTVSCTSARLPWLAFPAALARLTAALLAWAVARGWARRATQPAWKDNLLPLVLDRERLLVPHDDDTGGRRERDQRLDARCPIDETALINPDQRAAAARNVSVRFRWCEGLSSSL